MTKKHVLVLSGGGGSEHQISQLTANFLIKQLSGAPELSVKHCEVNHAGEIIKMLNDGIVDYAIPCFHGYPGETGDVQSLFEMLNVPYLGANAEASKICFNKITTKLWLDTLNIPNVPFQFLSQKNEIELAHKSLQDWNSIFVKASNQGSSVGCYRVDNHDSLDSVVDDAFKYSEYLLIEKALSARELEVAVYTFDQRLVVSYPGEIVTPQGTHYSYEQKYNDDSSTTTFVKAQNLNENIVKQIKHYAQKAFTALKIKDLARIDFFLTDEEELYLNEINTFPGMTPISMFPKMMEANGHNFGDFLKQKIVGKNC
ncbi:MAG: D-alanine--D-alanine ligase [Bacteriovoracaceae bacterium]|nr:D-alanine--D-alanine ligase [Bacteriovoracaceae bacterium]